MTDPTIRPAFSQWPAYNDALRAAIAGLTGEQLALRATPDRWPLWAIVGHLACQRVFWLCDFAGQSGVETTRFTNAAYNCPGDDDLESVLGASDLVEALDSTFQIVERALDSWTVASLSDPIEHREWGEGWVHTRGAVIQRVFGHDVYHCADVNDILGAAGLPQVDLWS